MKAVPQRPRLRARYVLDPASLLDETQPLLIVDVEADGRPTVVEDAAQTVEDLVRTCVLRGERPLHVRGRDGSVTWLHRAGARFVGVREIPKDPA